MRLFSSHSVFTEMAIESDSALLNKRMEKHDTSLKKVQKYGMVADQLIERQKTFVDPGQFNDTF
jgi:hypothetical protein